MIATLKILSILLSYPEEEIRAGIPECAGALAREAWVGNPTLERIHAFMRDYAERDLYDLQERYVHLFDRNRSLCLHLFEHIHGESRERGQAMVDLGQLYAQKGLEISEPELPDYLPMFLEFASTLPIEEARSILGEISHIVSALEQRLRKRGSPYAELFTGIREFSMCPEDQASGVVVSLADYDPEDLDKLDEEWKEEPVQFGPSSPGAQGQGSCPAMREVLANMHPEHQQPGNSREKRLQEWEGIPS